MDFFEHQEVARRKTRLLVGYYILAVVLITMAVYAAVSFAFSLTADSESGPIAWWDSARFLIVALATGAVFISGTTYKIAQLAQGGAAVASLLGGRPIPANTRETSERRLLNIVEEMAIASGTPIPQAFVMDEEASINAFAAGFGTRDAVVAVTRGALDGLTRDELQGVIAHEFSHILNGDMRLNIKLIGVLHGILLIALIGQGTLRTLGRSRTHSSSRKGKGNGGIAVILLLAFLLMLIGYIGVFFAKLIKSAVSRQREFLADASSVQFTRNPSGLASALRKIWKRAGSQLQTAHAEEASHLFFANGLASSWMSLMATHPAMDERIRRIDPAFLTAPAPERRHAPPVVPAPSTTPPSAAPVVAGLAGFAPAAGVMARVGALEANDLAIAASDVAVLPNTLREAVRTPAEAEAVLLAMLLAPDRTMRSQQMQALRDASCATLAEQMESFCPALASLPRRMRLPLASLAVAALRDMRPEDYETFRERMLHLVESDTEVDLFEFMLQRMVQRRLDPVFRKTPSAPVRYYGMRALVDPVSGLLSCLASWGADTHEQAVAAFRAATASLPTGLPFAMRPPEECGLPAVDAALLQLIGASPLLKRQILQACIACVLSDRTVTDEEAELVCAVADSLDCPLPRLTVGAAA